MTARAGSGQTQRERAINDFHNLLAADQALSAELLDKLRNVMRANRLVYGERPIGVSLRPHLLEESQFAALVQSAQHIGSALEKVAAAALQSPDLMRHLGLTERELKLAQVDPGIPFAAITTRVDGFVKGDEIRFVEYNAENPSSLSDQEGLNRILFEVPAMATFAQRYRLRQFSAVERLLEALLETYGEWSGHRQAPNVAILDWKDLPTSNEFVLLRNHFATHGIRTLICGPEDLEYAHGRLRAGDFQIDLVYKRILIHELLGKFDDKHPLIQAYLNRDVCLVNPFRCKIMHKKASFELLTDDAQQSRFSRPEREAIQRCIPWTRRVTDDRVMRDGRSIKLLDFIRRNRRHLVLKPNDDYGGRGVYLGPHLDESGWDDAIATALAGDYVVQEAVDLHREEFPVFGETAWQLQPMFVDTNPFLFRGLVCGAMVRLSDSPIVNVTSGGGETGFFVIGDAL
jgi:hypothetical protein